MSRNNSEGYETPGYVYDLKGEELELALKRVVIGLEKIPEKIEELRQGVNYRGEIESLKSMVKQMKLAALNDATMERNGDGKPKWTNDTMREARANELLRDNEEWRKLNEELQKVSMMQLELDRQLGALDEQSKIYRATIPALVALYERETLVIKTKKLKNITIKFLGE